MRKVALLLLALGLVAATTVHAANPVRISQVYGGGGSTYKADYVELFNNSSAPVSIGGWSVQYASSTGTAFGSSTYSRALIPSGATIPACGYYLVTGYVSTAGANLPVTADLAQGSMNLNSTAAKVALFSDQVFNRTCATAQSSGMLVDLIGWGGANCSETSTAAASDNTSVLVRGLGGATDSDNNSADFSKLAATGVTIHNSASAANPQCAPVSALRLEENFDFTGNLTANGWIQSGTTGTPTIASSSPGLTYSGYAGSAIGNSAAFAAVVGQRVSRSFTSVGSGSVYLAFLLNGTSAAITGDTFVQLGQALGGTQCNFFAKSAAGGFNMGIGKAFTATYATPVYSLNTTYLVVVKYMFITGTGNDEVKLFVNPVIGAAEPTAAATATAGTDATGLGHLQIEQYSANQLAGRIDGIRIATTWADAVASGSAPTPPAAPVATAATSVTSTDFQANWNASTGATSYRLDVSTDSGFGTYVTGYQDLAVSGTSQAVSGLTASTTYYYRVRAVNAAGTSGNSNTITVTTSTAPTPPAAPVATAGTSVTTTGFQANWNASSGATSYRLDVSTSSGFGTYVTGYQDLTVAGLSQAVSGLTASTTYYYRVRAVNAAGTSGNSNTITAATSAPPVSQAFTLVLIPDTQTYTAEISGGTMAMYTAQTQWIVNNRVSRNIAAVGHLGDITEDDTAVQWQRADGAHDLLENPATTGLTDGIPYVMNFGNHDDNGGGTLFDQYFGISRFSGRGYYGGHWSTTNKNSYILFSAGGLDWVMVSLQFHPDEVSGLLDWADEIFASYPNRKGILITHSMLYPGLDWSPGGENIYNALKDRPNLVLAACGHLNGSNWRTDVYGSNKLTTMVSDYQGDANGGNGYLRYLEIDPALNQVRAFTYSPYAGTSMTDAFNQFVLNDVPLGGGAPTVPAAPVATAATSVTQSGFQANWNASTGASSYRLDVSTSSSFTSYVTGYQDLTVTGLSRAVSGLSASTAYYYRARAANAAGTSGSSNTITATTSAPSTPPAAPVATAATNVLGTSCQANWNASGGATSYRLDVSADESFATFVAGYQDLTVSGLSQAVSGLSASTSYYYRVRAVNAYGTSGNSNVITLDTGVLTPPAAPVATAGTSVTTTSFQANWSAASGAASYRLDVSTNSGFTSYIAGYQDLTVSGVSQAVSGLSASTAYYYRVRAVNADGTSGNSNTITVTTGAPVTALLVEDFAFTGNLTANGWTQSGTGTPTIAASTPGLVYSGYAGSDIGNSAAFAAAAGEDVSKSFTSRTSGSVYLAFLLNLTAAGSTTGAYFFEMGQAQAAMNCNLHARSATGGLNLGISKAGTATWGSAVYSLNTTYLVTVKYTFITGTGNDEVKLFVNPVIGAAEPTATATATAGTDATGLGYLQIQQYSTSQAAGRIDGIRIATTWADAVASGAPPTPPAAPVATAGTSVTDVGFTANWNASSGATSYRLDVSTNSGFTSYVAGYQDLTVSGVSQAVSGLTASTAYYYRVRAVNAGGTSGNSNTITATTTAPPPPPAAPVATAATSVASTSFQANWNASSGATSYRLDVSTSSSFTSYVTGYQDKTVSGTSQAVSGLTASTPYYYRVRAVNSAGTSGNSNTITVTTSAAAGGECELIVLPDTQEYTKQELGGLIGMFTAQTQWAVNNRAGRNIVAVANVGDICDSWGEPAVTTEYNRALTATNLLEDPATTGLPDGIPYIMVMGNHDYENAAKFNSVYGVSRFTGRSYYGGHYSTTNDNSYILFSGAGLDFVLIGLSYSVSSAELTWAKGVLDAYPNRIGIVTSHAILNESSSIPASWNGDGSAIYTALKLAPNLRLMVCGHMSESSSSPSWHGEGRRSDVYNGVTVHSCLSDYQDRESGGNGKLRIYQFVPAENKVRVRTYSPYTNVWEADADSSSQFTLTVNLAPPGGAMMSPAPVETDEPAPVIRSLALAPPMPNPARGTTRFSFDLPRAMSARLEVLDVQGRLVATLADGEFGPGRYERVWDGSTARGRAAGLYFVHLQTPEGRLVRRVVVLD
jgi:predicted phage tail protein